MSNLIASLMNNADALRVHAYGAEIAGKNMANVNNPEYARQRINVTNLAQVETEYGPQSVGITVESISHARSALLDSQVAREQMTTARYAEELKFGKSIQNALGEGLNRTDDAASVANASTNTGDGISGAIDQLFQSFQDVAGSPTDDAQKQVLLEHAETLAFRFNEIDRRIGVVDTDLANQITTDVTEVNRLLDDIANFNEQINRLEIRAGGTALDLRDKRQASLEELAKLVNYETEITGSQGGDLRIFVRDGASNPIDLVNGRMRPGDLAYDGTSVFSVGGTAVTVSGGALAGAQAARDDVLGDTRANLNNLATVLISEVNTAYNGNFFSGTGSADMAVHAALNVTTLKTTDTADAGANELMIALAELAEDATVSFTLSPSGAAWTGTFSQRTGNIVAQTGSEVQDAAQRLESQELVERMLLEQRDGLSAVSMDEEVADLLRYQRAFQGSARVMNTMDQMLEWIVTRL